MPSRRSLLALLCVLPCLAAPATSWAAASSPSAPAPYAEKAPPLSTPWTRLVSPGAPLPEYPRPQLKRSRWVSLNGRWEYGQATAGQRPPIGQTLAQTILVPFPVQSALSGIERGDTMGWYRRLFAVPSSWGNLHVLLNFGAVSWRSTVYVNGQLAGTHRGDYTAFSLDITKLLHRHGPNELVVGFDDPIGGAGEPVGKQVPGQSYSFYHTASSGIWQTVWLEPVAAQHISSLDLTPDLSRKRLVVHETVAGLRPGGRTEIVAQAIASGRVVATAIGRPNAALSLPIAHPITWSPWRPYLYGLRVRLVSGNRVLDSVASYFGMRSITLGVSGGARRILLNGHFVFETGALDQGYWPDGVYTAPTDAALRFDILAAKRLGYDLVREHVKVEPDRWYYWADRLGILVWQDMPNMPIANRPAPTAASETEFRKELEAIVAQHRSSPSIIAWVPFNEGWEQFDVAAIAADVKRLDPSALVDADSGSANCCNAIEPADTDIRDSHLYFGPFAVPADRRASVIGEYGGVLPYPPAGHRWPGVLTSIGSPVLAWGVPAVADVLRQQYAELAEEMRLRGLSGAVFTELTSAEQELGIVSADRRVYTLPSGLVHALNASLIAASEDPRSLARQPPAAAPRPSGVWRFNEGAGGRAGDASGQGHALTLGAGAAWVAGVHGSALRMSGGGQAAVAATPLVNTGHAFTVSAWLRSDAARQSASAVSELGPDGSSFSLGIDTELQGVQSLSGEVGRRPTLVRGYGTWWTFEVPVASSCLAARCGVRANLRYDDGRYGVKVGTWHYVTGVYDTGTRTIEVYVDGVPEDVEHVRGVPPARGPLTIGAGSGDYASGGSFAGAVDDLRTYARALSPAEVWQLYRAEQRH